MPDKSLRQLSVHQMLTVWGEAQLLSGPGSALWPDSLDNDHTRGSADDMASQAAYVENTNGFSRTKPALKWVYVGQNDEAELDEPELEGLWAFRRTLRARIKTKPWIPPLPHDALCSYDQAIMAAQMATAKVDAEAGRV